MPDPTAPEGSSVEGQALLSSLGYNQELKRALSTLGNIALVLSDITPTASLLVIGTVVIATAGTGSVTAYLIGCFLAINVALCMGELGSMFPVAGGLFSIVTRVLGKPIGFLAMLDYMGQAVFLPASVAVGIGVYISALNGTIPSNVAAAVIMIIVTGVALFAINFNAILTGFFLALELAVVSAMALSGLVHLQQPLSVVTNPVMTNGKSGLTGVGASLVIAAIAVAMFSVNGYDSAINFAEETAGEAKHVGRAVVVAASIGIAFELGTFLLVFFGVPNIQKFVSSPTPLLDAARSSFGDTFFNIVAIGAIIAIFNACLAITLQFARIVWAAGRDRAWPEVISAWIGKVDLEARRPLGRDADRRRACHHPFVPGQPGRRRHVHGGAADRPLRADLHLRDRQPHHAEGSAATMEDAALACPAHHRPGRLRHRPDPAEDWRPDHGGRDLCRGADLLLPLHRPRGDRYWNIAGRRRKAAR